MKKPFYIVITCLLCFSLWPINAFAAITEQQLNKVLTEKGWDRKKFDEFLNYYELTLNDFDTKKDLSEIIGTPINKDSLTQLLADYGLSRNDIDILLGEFGIKVEDHWSIEELDASIDFYINHQNEINDLEKFLSSLGVTSKEGERLFKHFDKQNQIKLEEHMEQMGPRIDSLLEIEPESELTSKQINELKFVWEDLMKIVNITPKFYLVNGKSKVPVTFKDLVTFNDFKEDALFIEIYDEKDSFLLDMQVSKEKLSSDFVIHSASKLIDIGDLAGDLTKLRYGVLPNTASPFSMNLLIGLMMILLGTTVLFIRKMNVKQQK